MVNGWAFNTYKHHDLSLTLLSTLVSTGGLAGSIIAPPIAVVGALGIALGILTRS